MGVYGRYERRCGKIERGADDADYGGGGRYESDSRDWEERICAGAAGSGRERRLDAVERLRDWIVFAGGFAKCGDGVRKGDGGRSAKPGWMGEYRARAHAGRRQRGRVAGAGQGTGVEAGTRAGELFLCARVEGRREI